jgi:hypothetical protein
MKVKLADVAAIRSGYQFRGKVEPDPEGNVRVVQMKDITEDRGVRTDDLTPVQLARFEPHLLSPGDVLFVSRGYRLVAAPVGAIPENTIASGQLYVLRPEKNVLPGFLAWAINQPEFQTEMRSLVRGSHIPLITKSDFAERTISVPPLPVQQMVVRLAEQHDRERELEAAIASRRAALVHAVSRRLAAGQLKLKGK